jgi:hypothetical protein
MFGNFPDDLLEQFKRDYAERQAMALGYPMPSFADKSEMACNKPQQAPAGAKQKYIVKACANGQEKTVRFGLRGMQDFLQHKNEKRRENFKARHRCSEKKDKLTPGWWACNYNW